MVKRKQIWRLGLIALLIATVACVEETPGLFIVHNAALNDSCEPSSSQSGDSVRRGRMDLTIAQSYRMFPLVENVMSPSGAVSLGGGSATADYEGNRVTFQYAKVSFSVRGTSTATSCLLVNQEIGISGTLGPNESRVVELEVISRAMGDCLRAVTELRERGGRVEVDAEVQFVGMTASGTEVESNAFTYPLEICRGCLIEFPLEADDPSYTGPDCQNEYVVGEDSEAVEMGCFPGQDEPVDCRLCKVLVLSQGGTEVDSTQACEPSTF